MKNNLNKLLIITLLSFMYTGCDIEPEYYSQVAPDTYYDSKEAVLQRFARPFTHARWTFAQDDAPFILQELTTDAFCSPVRGTQNADKSSEDYKMHYHDFPVHFGASYQVYISRMAGVARCWAAIDDLSEVDLSRFGISDETWNNWVAQITAMAALYYLEAFDCFGGLPLYAESAEFEKPRSSAKETFYFIEGLFKKALPDLEAKPVLGGQESGYIKKAAAALGLARLYFNANVYIGEDMYKEAEMICRDIIDCKYGQYDLEEDWTKIFGFENQNSKEIIWSIPSERAQLETDAYYLWSRQMPANMNNYFGGIVSSSGENKICLTPSKDAKGNPYTYKLGSPFSKFEDTDVRKKQYRYLGKGKYEGMFVYGKLENPDNPAWKVVGTQEYYGKTLELVDCVARLSEGGTKSDMNSGEENSGVRMIKFSPRPSANESSILFNPDIPLMRLTEAYYILAECKMREGQTGEAAKLINRVRSRYFADGKDPNPVTAANLDKLRG